VFPDRPGLARKIQLCALQRAAIDEQHRAHKGEDAHRGPGQDRSHSVERSALPQDPDSVFSDSSADNPCAGHRISTYASHCWRRQPRFHCGWKSASGRPWPGPSRIYGRLRGYLMFRGAGPTEAIALRPPLYQCCSRGSALRFRGWISGPARTAGWPTQISRRAEASGRLLRKAMMSVWSLPRTRCRSARTCSGGG
jgi:hypothetical protein